MFPIFFRQKDSQQVAATNCSCAIGLRTYLAEEILLQLETLLHWLTSTFSREVEAVTRSSASVTASETAEEKDCSADANSPQWLSESESENVNWEDDAWKKEQVWPFCCCCCAADSQTDAGRHQLYNNGPLVLFSTAWLNPLHETNLTIVFRRFSCDILFWFRLPIASPQPW